MSSQQVRVQVLFTEETQVGPFTDSIYFSQAEYATKNQSDIDTIKNQRKNDYVNSVLNSPSLPEPTLQELQAQAEFLQSQLDLINEQIEEF